MKRYVIEFGLGTDFHGQDVSKAAEKAVKDAVSKSCLCGLKEILELNLENEVIVNVTVAVSDPKKVQIEKIKSCLPIGKKNVMAVTGGLKTSGLYLPAFGDVDDSIEVAIACIEVGIEKK